MNDLTKNENLSFKIKKGSGFALLLYLGVNLLITILIILLDFLIELIANIEPIIQNQLLMIISVIVIEFISTYLFIKKFNKKYVLNDSKGKFLNTFHSFIIILLSLSMLIQIWNGSKRADTRVYSLLTLNNMYLYSLKEDLSLYENNIKDTPYSNCKTESDIRETTYNLVDSIVYDEILNGIIISIVHLLAETIFMSYFVKKLNYNVDNNTKEVDK